MSQWRFTRKESQEKLFRDQNNVKTSEKFTVPGTTYSPKRIQLAAIKPPNNNIKPIISHTLAPARPNESFMYLVLIYFKAMKKFV